MGDFKTMCEVEVIRLDTPCQFLIDSRSSDVEIALVVQRKTGILFQK